MHIPPLYFMITVSLSSAFTMAVEALPIGAREYPASFSGQTQLSRLSQDTIATVRCRDIKAFIVQAGKSR